MRYLSRLRSNKQIPAEATETPSGQLITITEPASDASEAYRTLRTGLLYVRVDTPPKVILVTSPGSTEGKSTVCANLGVVMAQADKRTLIVDCDLRRPTIHHIFGVLGCPGIVEVLGEERNLEEVWCEPMPNLKVVPGGIVPPNPAELLGSRRFLEFLGGVRNEFDHVLLDSPPAGKVSDAAVLAAEADGVVLTVDAGKTRKVELRRTVRGLEATGATVLGTVMNNFKTGRDNQRSRYHGSAYHT